MKLTVVALLILVQFSYSFSQTQVAFDTVNWEIQPENIVEFDGRTCLNGEADLKNVKFHNGIIETDLWVDGSRSYPGIVFRSQSPENYESLYLRPHRAGLYDDAIQYTPAMNSQECWQLYHGKGYTSKSDFARNKWLHLKLVVKDKSAEFFIDDMTKPALKIDHLAFGESEGTIGLRTWGENNYFSNFRLASTDNIDLLSGPDSLTPIGNLTDWEISKIYSNDIMKAEAYPRFFEIYNAGFEKINPEQNGIINISRYRKIDREKSQQIYARTFITSEKDQIIKVAFGYTDAIKIFLNQKPVYSGNYAYRSRGNSFSGTIFMKDTLYLDLKKGINELFLISSENFGGWGFAFKSVPELKGIRESEIHPVKLWETKIDGLQPESVIYDSINDAIYCSQFDVQSGRHGKPTGFISKMNTDGKIVDLRWIDSLYAPAGVCLYKDKLYILERKSLTEASVKSGKITNRFPFPAGIVFPNDIAADEEGNLYITNSVGEAESPDIFLFKDNHFEEWLDSDELSGVNGILYTGNEIVFGNSGKGLLQAVNIKTKNIRTIASIGASIIDGIEVNGKGNYLVSTALTGNLYEVTGSGEVIRLINAGREFNIANFNYVESLELLLIPTFLNGTVQAYKLNDDI